MIITKKHGSVILFLLIDIVTLRSLYVMIRLVSSLLI